MDRTPKLTGDALAAQLLQPDAALRQAAAHTDGSEPALESALASISAEVTADAVERMERARTRL